MCVCIGVCGGVGGVCMFEPSTNAGLTQAKSRLNQGKEISLE